MDGEAGEGPPHSEKPKPVTVEDFENAARGAIRSASRKIIFLLEADGRTIRVGTNDEDPDPRFANTKITTLERLNIQPDAGDGLYTSEGIMTRREQVPGGGETIGVDRVSARYRKDQRYNIFYLSPGIDDEGFTYSYTILPGEPVTDQELRKETRTIEGFLTTDNVETFLNALDEGT